MIEMLVFETLAICIIVFIMGVLTHDMKYSLYTCVIRVIFRGKIDCMMWLMDNPKYLLYCVVMMLSFPIGLNNLLEIYKELI